MKAKRLNDCATYSTHPKTPLVAITLTDTTATKRLIEHTAKRVIKDHKDALQRLAYK